MANSTWLNSLRSVFFGAWGKAFRTPAQAEAAARALDLSFTNYTASPFRFGELYVGNAQVAADLFVSGNACALLSGTPDGSVVTGIPLYLQGRNGRGVLLQGLDMGAQVADGIEFLGVGTAFPTASGLTIATNAMFYHTGHGVLYYYDGTRWLSVNEYQLPIPPATAAFGQNMAATVNGVHEMAFPYSPTGRIFFTGVQWTAFVAGASSLGNSWQATLQSINAVGATTTVVGSAWDSNTRAIPANTYTAFRTGTAGTYDVANWPGGFWTQAIKTGVVNNFYIWPILCYRLTN